MVKNDTFDNVVNALVNSINGANKGKGDANVFAAPNTSTQSIVLTARKGGTDGNSVTLAATVSASAKITATASGATLNGGQNTAQVGTRNSHYDLRDSRPKVQRHYRRRRPARVISTCPMN